MTTLQGEELFRTESPWTLVFDAVPDATMILDRHHRIIRINKAAAALLGMKQEDAVGRKCYEIVHRLSEPPAFCPHARLLADGKEHEAEVTDEKLGGTFHISASPILDSEGKPIGGVHVARNVTARKLAEDAVRSAASELELKVAERTAELLEKNRQLTAEIAERELAEKSLKKSEQRFRDMAELLPQFVFETDTHGFFTFANRAGMEALGISEEHIGQGLSCLDLFLPEDVPKVAERMQRVLGGESVGGHEYWVKGKGGAAFPVVTYSLPIVEEGNVVGVRGVAIDLSEQKKKEQALRESHRKLITLLGNLPGMVYRCRNDNKRTMEFVSEGCTQLTGYAPEDLVNNNILAFRDLVHPEDALDVWNSIRAAVTERSPYELTYRIYTAWGGEKWVSERGVGVFPDDGDVEALEGCIFDITEQKRVEKALKKSEALLRNVLETMPVGVWLTDKHGKIVMGNPAGRQAWSGASDAGIGQYGGHKGWWPHTGERIGPHEWAGARALTKGETCIDELVEIECFDGTRKMILQSAVPIWDPPGEISGAIIVNQDVTARVKAERELKDSERKMRQIIECSPIGVTIVRDGRYEFVNSAFVKIFGYDTADEIIGLSVEALYAPQELDRIESCESGCIESVETPSFFERTGIKKSGDPLDLSVWVREMEILGEPAVLVFVIDASEVKALRAQLVQSQKKEAIGTLAGGIAHDFNNLLTVITGYTELLLMTKAQDDPTQEDLQKVGSAAARGAELVHQLLTFLRTDETEPRPLNVNQEVEQVVKLVSRTIPKMITIETSLAPHPKTVNADPGQIEQVLLNLVLNAKDAMPEGGILTFETRLVALDEKASQVHFDAKCGEYMEVTVSDTGTGMDEQTRERIFEPFFTTKESGRGTGLGLATVNAIVKQHSGFVTCTSQQGKGTSFQIYLPVHRLEEPDEEKAVPSIPMGGTETILLVDDEEPIRELGRKILEHGGYTVVVAKDGEEALQLYRKEHSKISLVLLDLIMPKMGGRQCLKELTAVNPAAKVLITSGYSSGGRGVDAAALGALGFIKKPHRASELLQRVREALDAP